MNRVKNEIEKRVEKSNDSKNRNQDFRDKLCSDGTFVTKACMVVCVCIMTAACGWGCASKTSKGVEVHKEAVESVFPTLSVASEVSDGISGEETTVPSDRAVGAEQEETVQSEDAEMVVYVCGAVNNPGIYTLKGSARMADAVEAAGGMSAQADRNVLNLAQYISDGQMVRIPAEGEVTKAPDWTGQLSGATGNGEQSSTEATEASSGKVNINTADRTALMTIPGVGQSKAEAIIQYRQEHGGFGNVEEIMQVAGIKEGSFAKMEPYICVE